MSTRNYRVMKHLNESGKYEFGIYEVYYDINGKVIGWTEQPLTPVYESEKTLQEELHRMQNAFKEETLTHQ
jgi:hypothetical protein